jgi:hypothetical protein
MKRLNRTTHRGARGQSLVELSGIVIIFMLVIAAVVEFGFLINAYLHVVDGARESARMDSNSLPFYEDPSTGNIDPAVPDLKFYVVTAAMVARTMSPIDLNPYQKDDVVISVYTASFTGKPNDDATAPDMVQFPKDNPNGWSMCENFTEMEDPANISDLPQTLKDYKTGWDDKSCTAQKSMFDKDAIKLRLGTTAPATGVLVVEVFYHYSQVLGLPLISQYLPNPMPVYTYTIMPMSAADPTPTKQPPP